MKKISMWAGALGVIGSIIFMLKNNYEDRKEIKRLDEERKFWKDAYKKANLRACGLEVEKRDIRFILRAMEISGELNEAALRAKLVHTQAEMLDDYIWSD